MESFLCPFYKRPPRKHYPPDGCELLLASPGHCATNAFLAYLREHNPGRVFHFGSHAPAVSVWAVRRDIPVVCMTRNAKDWCRSRKRADNHTIGNLQTYYTALSDHDHGIHYVSFEDVVADPAMRLDEISERFDLGLDKGDGVLPFVKMYSSAPPTNLSRL